MRQLISGAIGIALGLIIVVSSLSTMSGDAPKNERNKPFRTGQYLGLATGGIMAVVGGAYFFGQLYLMRDDLFGPPRRRRLPSRQRSRDVDAYDDEPRRRRPREEDDDYDDGGPRRTQKSSMLPIVIGGAFIAVFIAMLGIGGVIWFAASRSIRRDNANVPPIQEREKPDRPHPGPERSVPPSSEEAKKAATNLAGSPPDADAAMKTLIAMGAAAEGAVIPYLDHDKFMVRFKAGQVIEQIGTSASIPELRRVIAAKRSVGFAHENAVKAIEQREKSKKS